MTYYNRQVASISAAVYSNVYLTRQVISAKHFIDTNFTDNITLDDICKEACISKFHLVRSFKKLYGTTPYQYLTSVRINKAKTLLRNKASVAEVCYSVGFESLTSFTALFKKKMGRAPSAFKP
ncbi:MAG: AraC family transcriptional regulator [Ginsengibacter sp.]